MENRWLAEIQIPKSKTKKMESYEGENHIYTDFCFTGVCEESPWDSPINPYVKVARCMMNGE
jgi:hypothetical protein